jgi:YihY family inner membrane protein
MTIEVKRSARSPSDDRDEATAARTEIATDDAERRDLNWFQSLLARLDHAQARRAWSAVLVATVKKFGEDRAGNLAALIAYYGFFSLFPLLLVLVTIVGFALSGNEDLQRDIVDSALVQFPVIGDQLRNNAGELGTSGFALVAGLVTATWAGIGVLKAAQDAMNDIWDVPMRRRPNFLLAIVRSVGMLALLGASIVATTILTGAMGAVGTSLVPRALGIALSAALNVGLFLVAFHVLTVRDATLRQLVPGATVAGLAWVALQLAGGYLVSHQVNNASDTYGTFAVVIGLLWWIYLQAQAVLFAAELNVVLADHLWPRSLTGPDRRTDRRALRQHAQVEERVPEEAINVDFDARPRDPDQP